MCQSVNPGKFRFLREQSGTIVLDVRNPKEKYEDGFIPGHELIDFNEPSFTQKISNLDKDKTYLVYCRSGNRAQQACGVMHSLGFSSVINLEGGFQNWKATFDR